MRSRLWAVCAFAGLAAISVLLLSRPPAAAQDKDKPVRVKWEYRTAPPEKLAELGDEGWEVVAVSGGQPYIDSSRVILGTMMTQNTVKYAAIVYHMKRPK